MVNFNVNTRTEQHLSLEPLKLVQLRVQTVDTQDKLTRLEQRSLNTRPTNKLPTMPSEYVFSVAFNDKDILPANTQEQEREFG